MNQIKILLLFLSISCYSWSETARFAVAANFVPTMKTLVDEFHLVSIHRIQISTGSSGKFATQIIQGAPYDMFFSANVEFADTLIDNQLVYKNSKTIYALGQLVFWSNNADFYPINQSSLTHPMMSRIALANPKFAPYGKAAEQVLSCFSSAHAKIITAENVAQSFHFVKSTSVDGGFIALSQVKDMLPRESYWIIPARYYSTIEQASVILERGKDNLAVGAFNEFMKTAAATKIIETFGYEVPNL